MAIATLITPRDEKRRAPQRALWKSSARAQGECGEARAGMPVERRAGVRFQRGGKRIAAHGPERLAARTDPGGVRRSGVDRAGRPHYLNRAWALSRRARHEVPRPEGPGNLVPWGIV